jgi:hypothetical protein
MRYPLLAAVLLAGCSSGPRAPALIDSAVYEDDREGFRFLVPEGWKISGRAELPPAPVPKLRMLVNYHRPAGTGPSATMEVSAGDLPPSTDWAEKFGKPSYGVRSWTKTGAIEHVSTQGADGERWQFQSEGSAKEVTVFRRKDRVYLFTLVYSAKDPTARDQYRRAIGSLIWKN